MKKIFRILFVILISFTFPIEFAHAKETKLSDYPEMPISPNGEYLFSISGQKICLTEQDNKKYKNIWKKYFYREETLVGLRNFVFSHIQNKELLAILTDETPETVKWLEGFDQLASETTKGRMSRLRLLELYDNSFTHMFKYHVLVGLTQQEAIELAIFKAYASVIQIINNLRTFETYNTSLQNFWKQENKDYKTVKNKDEYCRPLWVKEHVELHQKLRAESLSKTQQPAQTIENETGKTQDSSSYIAIWILLFFLILLIIDIYSCFIFTKFERIKEKIKTQLDDYLIEQNFDFNEKIKYLMMVEPICQEFEKSTKQLKSVEIYSIVIFGIICYFNKALAIIIALAATFVVLIQLKEVFKASHFDEDSLKKFTCPQCHQKVCWFMERTYNGNEKHYTTHERKEETDSKGNIHIVYAPIDRVKYTKYTTYRCSKCHHEEETTEEFDNRIN